MRERRTIGLLIKQINNVYEKELNRMMKSLGITSSQCAVLDYLFHSNEEEVTQRDIERHLSLKNPTVTGLLQRLEEKGFIEKETAADNKKHVNLLLTDSANELIQDGIRVQKQFAEDMLRGLTKEEIALCKQVFQKICDNAERCIKEKGQR